MDASSAPAAPRPSRPVPVPWPALLLAALVVAHFTWLVLHFAPAYLSPDAHGYFVQARLIATTGRTGLVPESVVQYVGMHWLETDSGVLHSRYPAGLPVLLAAAYKLGGPAAALLVNPVLASAALLVVFGLARRFAGDWGGLLAAAVVATTAIVNQHALNADSHVAAMFFLLAGVRALLGFVERPAAWWRGLAAGLLLGALPTVRYPEAVCGVAVAAYLFGRVRPLGRTWPAVVGAAVPFGALLLHNQAAYGAFWKTGYALTGEQTGFSWAFLAAHACNYLRELGGQAGLLFFGLGVAGLAALAVSRRWRAEGLLFAGVVVPLLVVYMAYYWGGGGGAGPGGGGGGLRFLIPVVPFFALGGAYLLMKTVSLEAAARRVVIGVVALVQFTVGLDGSSASLAMEKSAITWAAALRRELARVAPDGSVVIADQRLADPLDYTGQWRLVDASVLGGETGPGGAVGRRVLRGNLPGPRMQPGLLPMGSGGPARVAPGAAGAAGESRPSPMQQGKGKARRERYAGLPSAERSDAVWADIRAWAADRPVFWIGRSLAAMEERLPAGATLEQVGELEVPQMARPGGLAGGPNGMPGGAMGPRHMAGAGLNLPGGAPGGGRPFLPPGAGAGLVEPGELGGKLAIVRVTFAARSAPK